MGSTFTYSRFVTGKDFLSRKKDCTILANMLSQGENVAIMGSAKSGKMSLLRQTLFNMKGSGNDIVTAEVRMTDIRDSKLFICRLGSAVLRSVFTTPHEFRNAVQTYLSGTHLVFDEKHFSETDEVISFNWDPDLDDMKAIFRMPYMLSRDNDCTILVLLEDFQNIKFLEDGDSVIKVFDRVLREEKERLEKPRCSYVMEGSRLNAMKEIFCKELNFHKSVEKLEMTAINRKEIVEYVSKNLMSGGKVIERDLVSSISELLKDNMWYINQFFSICDYLSKGFIKEDILYQAMNVLIALHEPRFLDTMADLTNYQTSLLKAVIDENPKLSCADVIRRYGLNSSANVKRLKDALMKKEIMTIDDEMSEKASMLDPLFEHWLKNYFFNQ